MSAKRFKLADIGFVYNYDNLLGMKEIVELLNSLSDENEQLKRDKQNWYYVDSRNNIKIKKLQEENEILKRTIERNENYIKRISHKNKWR